MLKITKSNKKNIFKPPKNKIIINKTIIKTINLTFQ